HFRCRFTLARHFFHPAPAETPTRTLRTPAVLPAAGDSSLLSFPARCLGAACDTGSHGLGSAPRLHAAPGSYIAAVAFLHTSRILLSAGRCWHRQGRYE